MRRCNCHTAFDKSRTVFMIPFAGNPLDRASEKRGDAAWLAAKRRDPDLLHPADVAAAALRAGPGQGRRPAGGRLPAAGAGRELAAPDAPCVLLGLETAKDGRERPSSRSTSARRAIPRMKARWPGWAISPSCAARRMRGAVPLKRPGHPRPGQGDDRLAPAPRLLRPLRRADRARRCRLQAPLRQPARPNISRAPIRS